MGSCSKKTRAILSWFFGVSISWAEEFSSGFTELL